MHRAISGLLFVMVVGLLLAAVLFSGCRKNVYGLQSFEGAVCSHLLDVRGVKEGHNRDQIQNECVELAIKTEREAEVKGEGEKYHSYLECLNAASTYTDAQYCRKITGWDAN